MARQPAHTQDRGPVPQEDSATQSRGLQLEGDLPGTCLSYWELFSHFTNKTRVLTHPGQENVQVPLPKGRLF